MTTSTHSAIGTSLERLASRKQAWARLPLVDKIALLDSVKRNTVAVARDWVEAAVEAKGLSMDEPLSGEEWLSGPFSLLWLLRDLRTTLVRLATDVPVLHGFERRALPDGTVSVDVFPNDLDESILFAGIQAEVWMDRSVTLESLDDSVASYYHQPESEGGVTVVMGAGNVSSIAPMDVVHVLFNEGNVALLKLNPVNDYLGPFMEQIFRDLFDAGYVEFAYGDADVGEILTTHERTEAIHVTGSEGTYNAIVFGTADDADDRRNDNHPINERPVSAELGGVTPAIVVGGNWTKADLRFQAEHVVSQKLHNSGFNCVATQVLVLPENWDQVDAFLEEIRTVMDEVADRPLYYPGAADRLERSVEKSSGAERFGESGSRILIDALDSAEHEWWLTNEIFAPALAVTRVAGDDVDTYLANATRFCNAQVAGTLGATLIIDPRTHKRNAGVVERTIRDLHYGTVCVNAWSGVAYFMSRCVWGAAPGNTRTDIGSGVGFVHNALMFDQAVKSVVRGPFAPAPRTFLKGDPHLGPKMVYFVTNKQAHVIGEKVVDYAADPSKAKLASVALSALRG